MWSVCDAGSCQCAIASPSLAVGGRARRGGREQHHRHIVVERSAAGCLDLADERVEVVRADGPRHPATHGVDEPPLPVALGTARAGASLDQAVGVEEQAPAVRERCRQRFLHRPVDGAEGRHRGRGELGHRAVRMHEQRRRMAQVQDGDIAEACIDPRQTEGRERRGVLSLTLEYRSQAPDDRLRVRTAVGEGLPARAQHRTHGRRVRPVAADVPADDGHSAVAAFQHVDEIPAQGKVVLARAVPDEDTRVPRARRVRSERAPARDDGASARPLAD